MGAAHGDGPDGAQANADSVFKLLTVFFSITLSLMLVTFLVWRALREHQNYWVKRYRLDEASFVRIRDGCDVAWSAMGWFSVSIGFTMFNKWIMQLWHGGCNFPITMTTIHMLLKVVVTRIYICVAGLHVPALDWTQTLRVVVPIGVLTGLDIALSNLSIPLLPLSLYTALKTTVPVWSFVMSIAFGLEPFRGLTFLAISLLVGGLAVAVEFRTGGSLLGVVLVLGTSLSGGLRWVLTQVLVETDHCSKHVMVAIYRFSPASCLFLLPLAVAFEGKSLSTSKFVLQPELLQDMIGLVIAGGLISIALIGFEIYILRATTAVSLGIMGQFKEIMQILLAIAIYHEKISLQTGAGLTVSILAAELYRRIKQGNFDGDVDGAHVGNVQMAMRKTSTQQTTRYNPLRSGSGSGRLGGGDGGMLGMDDGLDDIDEELTAGLDVFLEVHSDGECSDDELLLIT